MAAEQPPSNYLTLTEQTLLAGLQSSYAFLALQETIKCICPLDHDNASNVISTAVFRVSQRTSFSLKPKPDALDSIWRLLRSQSMEPTATQLEQVYVDVRQLQEAANSLNQKRPRSSLPLEEEEISETLRSWNEDASRIFDHIAITSHAGTRYTDARPTLVTESDVTLESATKHLPSNIAPPSTLSSESQFSPAWLRLRCSKLEAVRSGALSPSEMAISVLTLLTDNALTDDLLQGDLFDAFAGDFDGVADVLSHREQIKQLSDAVLADCNQALELEQSGVAVGSSAPQPRERGVKSRRARAGPSDRHRGTTSTQITIRDKGQEVIRKEEMKERRRLVKAGILSVESDEDLDDLPAVTDWGSAFDERSKAFPGVQMLGDSSIGAVDRVGLPKGSTREVGKGYEEIFVPPPSRSSGSGTKLVEVAEALSEHPELLSAMKGVKTLNRLQSSVFATAFDSDENLLVCAPTGAGKTNVALLTIFREILAVKKRVQRSFKVVYVAPMKALAAEVTEKFGGRLDPLGLRVREFTGDMSLTRLEALETHVLVTTPEKWDVVTRKSGSDLAEAVTLFIIDEIHLLHDGRGAVLESIVARTLRLSETAQRQIRLVGLSATLPNYADVGSFMRVNPEKGLFHFDGSHRPVPLSQTFIGISEGGSSNSGDARRRREGKMHEMAWKKVKDSLQRGHQAMIFVHSRKGTAKAAKEMIARASEDSCPDIFLGGEGKASHQTHLPSSTPLDGEATSSVIPTWAAKEISRSRTAEIRELCMQGVGIHNAGLPRPDRKLVEKLFSEGIIRLLCCTATLAWGVNLPARSVIIMGTEVYDSEKGAFVQLGMLDVMQIFGRAGRPQFDTEGEGSIITMHEHLSKYLTMLTSSVPIESQLGSSASRLADHLNAEIVSGTVSSIGEGVRWLSYTYLSVRMPQNPLVYGIDWAEVAEDHGLHSRRASLVQEASKALDDARMCRYDNRTGVLSSTDFGRVASHYYVSHETIVLWNELFENLSIETAVTDEEWEDVYALVIHAVSCATEFEQMRSRQEEADELDNLARKSCPIPLKAGSETREGKVSILLQAYISRAVVRMSDLSYIVQSATRLLRAFFEISIRRGIPSTTLAALELARASESRIWPFQHPLWQFTFSARKEKSKLIQPETIVTIESSSKNNDIHSLRAMTKEELSVLVRAPKMAAVVQRALQAIPTLAIEKATVAPLSRTVLSISVELFPDFRWTDVLHGNAESWWLWIEDMEENRVYHSQKVLLTKRQVQSLNREQSERFRDGARKQVVEIRLTVPVFDPPSSQYWVRIESDRWHSGGGSKALLSVASLNLPHETPFESELLDLRPLPVHASLTAREAALFDKKFSHFNPIQSQSFHVARHTDENILVSAPFGSGSWVVVELAILRAIQNHPNASVVVIAADEGTLKAKQAQLSRFRSLDFAPIQILTEDHAASSADRIPSHSILLATAEAWIHLTSSWTNNDLARDCSLFIFAEAHRMNDPAFAHIEVIATRIRHMAHANAGSSDVRVVKNCPRIVALTEVVPNAASFGEWLGVSPHNGLFCFTQSVRQVPCESHVVGIAGDRYSSRMHSMNRPIFSMIQRYSSKKPVVIFVSSRRQTLLTSQDLLRLAAIDGKDGIFKSSDSATSERATLALRSIEDMGLKRSVSNGIALCHDGMNATEREAVEELLRCGYCLVMICTFDMSRMLHVRAHQVIVKGSERYERLEQRYNDIAVSDILHMIGHAGRPGTDSSCYAGIFVHEPKKTLIKKFLHERFPVESSLHRSQLPSVLLREISSGRIRSCEDAVDWMSWSFMYKRLSSNPGYYGLKKKSGSKKAARENGYGSVQKAETDRRLGHCGKIVLDAVRVLSQQKCIVVGKGGKGGQFGIEATRLGVLSSSYGINGQCVSRLSRDVEGCKSVEDVVDAVCNCVLTLDVVQGFEYERMWREIFESIVQMYCTAGVYKNVEVAAKGLGVSGWSDSIQKRGKLMVYSLLGDRNLRVSGYGMDQKRLHEVVSSLVALLFDLAAESGNMAAMKEIVRASQALYQGILPTADVWSLSGYDDTAESRIGRREGWTDVNEVMEREQDFQVFMAKECRNDATRTGICRWLDKRPRLSVGERWTEEDGKRLVEVVVSRKRKSAVADSASRAAKKRDGGYVVVVCDADTERVVLVRRLAEPRGASAGASAGGGAVMRVVVPAIEGGAKLRVWVASDVHMGVEAQACVSARSA